MNELPIYIEVTECKGTDGLTGFHHWVDDLKEPCLECGARQMWTTLVERT